MAGSSPAMTNGELFWIATARAAPRDEVNVKSAVSHYSWKAGYWLGRLED